MEREQGGAGQTCRLREGSVGDDAAEAVESDCGAGAPESGVSPNPMRAQVRGEPEKTGCTNHTDIVALLGGLSLIGGERPA